MHQKNPSQTGPGAPPLLEFTNVTVMIGGKIVLDSASVTIYEGEHLVILGPNGSGKSSFIKTITREYYPVLQGDGVTFQIRGEDVWRVADLRSLLGIVSNDLQYTFTPVSYTHLTLPTKRIV